MTDRNERARWYLDLIGSHIRNGTENLNTLAKAYSDKYEQIGTKFTAYDQAWEFLDMDVVAVVRKDSRRLLKAVEAALRLADENSSEPLSRVELRDMVTRALLGEDEDD